MRVWRAFCTIRQRCCIRWAMLVVAPARSQANAFWSILDLTQPLLTLFQLVIDPCTQALHEVHGSGAYHVWLSHPLILRLSDFGEP